MLRTEAVEDLLVDEIARIRRTEERDEPRLERVARARRRALVAAALDWGAILMLFLLREPLSSFLQIGASEETIFTLAILAIAVHSGFRLGQWEKYGAVESAIRSVDRLRGG